ncbi:MAG TPA: transglycosylase SLT domain-containing protein [Candidatus Acidoferrum sp.]|nr:transglycosylase SLT domain-containing protein [Candidatus Acidoferrum sp.]
MRVRALLAVAGVLLAFCVPLRARTNPPSAAATKTIPAAKYLEQLSRELKDKNPEPAYQKLSEFAMRKASGPFGARAALALGVFDYTKAHYAQAAKWFDRTKSDPLLRDYSLYWSAENSLAQGQSADALAKLKQFRQDYPDSVITDQALQTLGEAALASNQPAEAVAALNAYSTTADRPALLFLRAEAHEQAGEKDLAAADYQSVYLRFALTEQAREAGMKLYFLAGVPGVQLPFMSLGQQTEHAATLFNAKDWGDARNEYAQLLPQLSGAERERAQLRILECAVGLGGGITDIAAMQVADPDVDAERFYAMAQYYRSLQQDAEMAAAVEGTVSRAPQSRWAESVLMLAANEYWVELDRDHAAGYYKRVEESFPTAPDAIPAHWRVAWAEVLKRQPDAAQLLADHIRRYPMSQFLPDALYWLGRLAEEAGTPGLARSYYQKLEERFPQNYFEAAAAIRLRNLAAGPADDPDVLASVPPPPAPVKLGDAIPAAAAERQARADALRSIAFDASAELELRGAYAVTSEPRLLIEVAQAAVDAGHIGEAIVTVRQVYTQLEARPFANVPHEVWLAAYAMPFKDSIRHWSERAGVDPMLVAGLIRQESAFEQNARSNRNAQGLMQLEPKTARLLASQVRVRYSQARLFESDYNVHLGTRYLANLRQQFGSIEAALAAYNAGEDRVTAWTAGQTYREPAEFVDSIPFTETREYVEIVTRNADIYHKLYGAPNEPRKAATRRKH